MEVIAKKVKVRTAHRGSAMKLLNCLKDRLSDEENPVEKFWLKESIQSMRLKIVLLKTLDDQIIELIASETTGGVEKRIKKEIKNGDSVRAELNNVVMRMEEVMSKFDRPLPIVQPNTTLATQVHSNMASGIPQQSKAKVRLPKLEVRKFNGRVQEWQEFWDAFESAIDQNESLTAVDKFAYLQSLVTEPARSTIVGFSLTAVNYMAAVNVLKKKYGKETAIQRAHVNDLLNLALVFSDKDTTCLMKLYDSCSVHFRGLKALGVQDKPAVSGLKVTPEANPTTTSPSSFHVGATDRVALQTARAVITGKSQPQRVRVLFDTGSHRSFVTARVAQLAWLPVTRQDWLTISTFGQRSKDMKLRDVIQVKVSPIAGESIINMEAYVVPEISSIPNTHVELVKSDYPNLRGPWFSDVSEGRDEMVIDVLDRADYLWHFQKGCTIRGNFDEPVAVETKLGWVLSGPMKGQDTCSDVHFTQVNFIASSVEEKESLEDVQRLWDLESLGIREITDQVHESFENTISFNGSRYSVCLPWKEGYPELPINYGILKRPF